MSKELIKIRKQWLIKPETQIHQPKRNNFAQKEQNFRNFEGNTKDIDFEELDEEEYTK